MVTREIVNNLEEKCEIKHRKTPDNSNKIETTIIKYIERLNKLKLTILSENQITTSVLPKHSLANFIR